MTGDHKNPTSAVLVALRMLRQRVQAHVLFIKWRYCHRAAILASGAVVTGVPSSSSGATKLYRNSLRLAWSSLSRCSEYSVIEQLATSADASRCCGRDAIRVLF